jgi:predicted Zn-dependent peptidase
MRFVPALAGVLGALVAAPLAAQAPVTYEHFTLDNGLSVFLVPNPTVPVVTVNVWYDVGSRLERNGRSGFAHLFEHMMFQGSANVGKGEHFQLIERAGGNMNGTTSEDRTNYFETLPSNRLNLGLWLEADRMRSLAITDTNLENQRETVKEERRLGVDNQPYAGAFIEGLPPAAYDSTACFGYSHSVIGSMADLNAATTADVKAFFDLHYAPNNATLTLSGDFDPAEAKALIQQYFGDIPKGAEPSPFECQVQYGAGARRVTWNDPLANLPAAFVAYRTPEHRHADGPALSLLNTILGEGESSRLNRAAVREQQIAIQSATFEFSRRGPGLLVGFAVANQGFEADTLAAAIHVAAARIAEEGITPEELEKAKNSFRRDHVFSRQTSMGMAEAIQHYVHFHDSVDEINTDAQKYLAVTAADIQRVARRYLVPANSVTILVVPKSQGATP